MQTTTSSPTVPVTLPVCLWGGCAGELRWRNAHAERFAEEIDAACEGLDSADMLTMNLPRIAVLALRGVGAFSDDYPEPATYTEHDLTDVPNLEPERPHLVSWWGMFGHETETEPTKATAIARALHMVNVELHARVGITDRDAGMPVGYVQRPGLDAEPEPESRPVAFMVCAHCEYRYPDTLNRCPACGCLDTHVEPEPRQVVTPAGTAYLLPGFEPAPREKGGTYQGSLF